jgi:DNA-binding transcriptional regulator GbsR (MarR family)
MRWHGRGTPLLSSVAMATTADRAAHAEAVAEAPDPESVRLAFARAWGDMGGAWGVQPSVALVHGYLLVHRGVLTEREVREALALSHRATSLALGELEGWALVERVPAPRPTSRRGPAASAWRVVGDQWLWLQRIARQRAAREADPLVPRIETCLELAEDALVATPGDAEAARLRAWLLDLLGFLRLFERAVGLLARAESAEIARGFSVLARIPDESLDRLLRLFAALPEDELAGTIEAISRVSPGVARRVLSAADKVARLAR